MGSGEERKEGREGRKQGKPERDELKKESRWGETGGGGNTWEGKRYRLGKRPALTPNR